MTSGIPVGTHPKRTDGYQARCRSRHRRSEPAPSGSDKTVTNHPMVWRDRATMSFNVRIGVFNGVALFVAWTPRGEQGDIPHLISVRKAESHEEQAWIQRYRKR